MVVNGGVCVCGGGGGVPCPGLELSSGLENMYGNRCIKQKVGGWMYFSQNCSISRQLGTFDD